MELFDAITTRRSIRSFQDRRIAPAVVTHILEAAICAPSAGNLQPWQFVILTEPILIEQICKTNMDALWGTKAPLGIVVCANLRHYRMHAFWIQDLAAVTQNILLLAHDQGIGATWTGIYPESDRVQGVRKILSMPADITPFSLILMGHPKTPAALKTRSLEGRVHYNRYPLTSSTRYAYISSKRPKKRNI